MRACLLTDQNLERDPFPEDDRHCDPSSRASVEITRDSRVETEEALREWVDSMRESYFPEWVRRARERAGVA